MPVLKLIEAVKNEDIESIEELLKNGEAIEQKDDYGWTALSWAAGKGSVHIIEKLLAAGANVATVGRDKRLAYQIALAAAHVESAAVLWQAGQKVLVNLNAAVCPNCKAYVIAELRQFSGWHELSPGLTDDAIVFVHQDLSVTDSILHGKDVIFDKISPAWEKFCENQLGFSVPTDLGLAAEFVANRPVETHGLPL